MKNWMFTVITCLGFAGMGKAFGHHIDPYKAFTNYLPKTLKSEILVAVINPVTGERFEHVIPVSVDVAKWHQMKDLVCELDTVNPSHDNYWCKFIVDGKDEAGGPILVETPNYSFNTLGRRTFSGGTYIDEESKGELFAEKIELDIDTNWGFRLNRILSAHLEEFPVKLSTIILPGMIDRFSMAGGINLDKIPQDFIGQTAQKFGSDFLIHAIAYDDNGTEYEVTIDYRNRKPIFQ
ncbi:MAG: hypothetical protein AB7T49_01755 [Oligoflexales bacterium]